MKRSFSAGVDDSGAAGRLALGDHGVVWWRRLSPREFLNCCAIHVHRGDVRARHGVDVLQETAVARSAGADRACHRCKCPATVGADENRCARIPKAKAYLARAQVSGFGDEHAPGGEFSLFEIETMGEPRDRIEFAGDATMAPHDKDVFGDAALVRWIENRKGMDRWRDRMIEFAEADERTARGILRMGECLDDPACVAFSVNSAEVDFPRRIVVCGDDI